MYPYLETRNRRNRKRKWARGSRTQQLQPTPAFTAASTHAPTMIMDREDFEGFEDIIDEIEEDICVDGDEDEDDDLAFVW